MRAGYFINQILEASKMPVPSVGMGATELLYTDRHAATIVAVSPSGKRVWVKRDHAHCLSGNRSESQQYAFTPNPEALAHEYSLRKNGRWVKAGESASGGGKRLLIGARKEYYDPSF